ncbi:hypothetical protein DH2020_050028 [Rehmannia glutinosa]|uniref:Fungal lipase-type domain-containing protein n=1 Tax=Rehmannia glutinosa TaxID=99300 RepID=A0ABR0U1V9_REHGL
MAATCNKCFSSNYMLLNPEDASFVDLCKILFSSDVGKRKFVDCPDGVREPLFGRRWIIFVSVLVQKMLKATGKPMSGFGSGVEYWLNLLSGNKGFFGLVMNSLKGKVVYPDRTSANFLSFTGSIDKRLQLDCNIGEEDCRYYSVLSVMAAKASYENHQYIQSIVKDQWKMDYLGSYDFWNDYQEKATTQAFVLKDNKDVIIVAFRGTETFDPDAWSSDFDISWYELPGAGKIHGGFLKALGMQKSRGWPQNQADNKPETAYYALRKLLKEKLQNNDKAKFIVTGHSLGGALAALFPAILSLHDESWLLDRLDGVVAEEPNKNYFSLLWLIPKIGNAFWELIRSFIISHTKGPDYKEGGLLRMFRILGLLAAGIPAHLPQDYVNATRLGSSDVFLSNLCSIDDQKILKMQ